MKIGFFITARLKSKRLKFKLLKDLNGYSVIERVIQRAKHIRGCCDIVLCTSAMNQDLPLIRTAKNNGIYYFNGSSEDVLQRLLDAAKFFGIDYIISMTADNPLFSIEHSNKILETFKNDNSFDYIYTSGMPIGLNVHGIKTKALEVVCKVKKELDTEIWGYLLNQPSIFNVKKIEVQEKYQKNYRMTLDEIDDYNFFNKLYKAFPKDHIINILEAFKYLEKNPALSNLNSSVKQRDLEDKIKRRISKFYNSNKDSILKIKQEIYTK